MCWRVLYIFQLFIWEFERVYREGGAVYVEQEKIYSLPSIKPFCHPAGVNLLLGGLRVWVKWMLTPGWVYPCVSSLVSAGLNSCDLPSRIKDKIGFIFSLLIFFFYCIYFDEHHRKKVYFMYWIVLKWIYINLSQKTRSVAVTMCRGTVRSTTVNLVSSICCSPRTLKCSQFKRRLAQWPFFRWAQTMFNVKRVWWQWIKQPYKDKCDGSTDCQIFTTLFCLTHTYMY